MYTTKGRYKKQKRQKIAECYQSTIEVLCSLFHGQPWRLSLSLEDFDTMYLRDYLDEKEIVGGLEAPVSFFELIGGDCG